MKKRKDGNFRLAPVIFGLVGQVAWAVENMYFNVFVGKMFHAGAEAISTMVAATVTTLLIGALADKPGKRKFFIRGFVLLRHKGKEKHDAV